MLRCDLESMDGKDVGNLQFRLSVLIKLQESWLGMMDGCV